jgi:outer membrane protein TolC
MPALLKLNGRCRRVAWLLIAVLLLLAASAPAGQPPAPASYAQNSTPTNNPPPGLPSGPLTRSLSLRTCFDLALDRNLDLRIEHLQVEMAGDELSSAYGVYSPNFKLDATHDYATVLGDYDERKFNSYFTDQNVTDELGIDLNGKVPFGFSYDLSSAVSKDQTFTDFRSDPEYATNFPGGIRSTNDHDAVVDLKLRQHLLKDFWIDADREVLLARRADLKISQQALRFQIMTTLLAVELAYYDLIAAREEVQVQEKTLELRQQFLAETRRRIELGGAAPLDETLAETQLQNTLTRLAAARGVFFASQNHLISLLTDDFKGWAGDSLQLTDTLQSAPPSVTRSDSFQSALSQRPDLIEARLAVEKTGALVKFRLNQIFPSLDLVGDYGGQGSENHFSGPALGDAFSFRNPEYSYGVVVSFPLDNATARGDYRASKTAKQVAELQLKKAEQAVLLQVADFVSSIDFCFSQVGSTHLARTYAESALETENKKYQDGFATSFEVLQFQETLTAARSAEIRAQVDYNKALAQLAFADGTMLERNRLSLQVK